MTSTAASITLNFEELQRELQAFNELFGLWTEQRRRALMDDKEAYLKTLSEEQDTVEALKKQYQQLLQQKQQIYEILEAEEKERYEYAAQNQDYAHQRDALRQRLLTIQKETDVLEAEVSRETRIFERRQAARELARGQRLIDLQLYREKLGIAIEPVEGNPNQSKVVFCKLDPKSPQRTFSFVVDYTDGYSLRLFQFSPALPSEYNTELTKLALQGDFYRVLHETRRCFAEAL